MFALQFDPAQLMRGMFSNLMINAQRLTPISAKLAKDYTSDAADQRVATDEDKLELNTQRINIKDARSLTGDYIIRRSVVCVETAILMWMRYLL